MFRVDADGEDGTDHGWASLTDAELPHVYLELDVHSGVELTVPALQHRFSIG